MTHHKLFSGVLYIVVIAGLGWHLQDFAIFVLARRRPRCGDDIGSITAERQLGTNRQSH